MSPKPKKATAKNIKDLLAGKHKEDVFVRECRVGWGAYNVDGYMDAWAMAKSWSKPLSVGYEIKCSRRDFVQDQKWMKYLPFCNQFYFVAPREVMSDDEIPEGAGLMIVTKGGNKLYTKKKAPWKKLEDGVLENLFKGLLMSRVKILDQSSRFGVRHAPSQKERIEAFVNAKEEDRMYGRALSGKLRRIYEEKIEAVEQESRSIWSENEALQEVKTMVTEMGISPGAWNLDQKVKDILLGEDTRELIADMVQLRRDLKSVIEKIS